MQRVNKSLLTILTFRTALSRHGPWIGTSNRTELCLAVDLPCLTVTRNTAVLLPGGAAEMELPHWWNTAYKRCTAVSDPMSLIKKKSIIVYNMSKNPGGFNKQMSLNKLTPVTEKDFTMINRTWWWVVYISALSIITMNTPPLPPHLTDTNTTTNK